MHEPNVQDWSLQCPSNSIWPCKIYLSQNNPSKRNPKLKTNTSLEVLDIMHPPHDPTSVGHCHYKKWSRMVDSWIFTLYWKHVPYNSCTSLICILYFISILLDQYLGFEPTLQLMGWNLRALQNETHMRASILNTARAVSCPMKQHLSTLSMLLGESKLP